MRVANFQVAVAFEIEPELILSLGPSIRALATRTQGRIHDAGVGDPDFPPDVPRIVIQTKQFLVNISLNRFDIHATPPRHLQENHSAAVQFAQTVAGDVLGELLKVPVSYAWSGIVAHLKYPSEKPLASAPMAVAPIFHQLINIPHSGKPLSSFEVRFGYQEDDLFRSIKLGGYATQNIRFKSVAEGEQTAAGFGVEGADIVETGVQVFLDVNNKPSAGKKTPIDDLKRLFEVCEKSILTLPEELNLKELLK
jgi:hypothetical protein